MDESALQRSLRARPPADPIYRPRLDASAIPQGQRRSPGLGGRARYRGAAAVLATVVGVGLSLGAISLFGGSHEVAPSFSSSPSPTAASFPPGSLGEHIVPALAELRVLSDALALAATQVVAADQEPLREPTKALRQWAIDEQGWSADRVGTSGCPELMEWKQAAWDLEVAASEEWRHIASGSPGDLDAVHAAINALLLMGEEIERHPC